MKLTHIAGAVALACASTSSFALTPVEIDGDTVQLWISGATAPTASVFKAIRKLCLDADSNGAPDDLHVYLTNTDAAIGAAADASPGKSKAGKWAAYACTMGSNAGALDGVKTIVYHTFDGGSFEAYTPHLRLAGEVNALVPATLTRLNNVATSCVPTAYATPDPTYTGCGSAAVTLAVNATQFAVPTAPVGGFSDTEYVLNKLNLIISKDLGDIGTEQATNVGQGFGVAASWPLYIEMQKAQGIIATTAQNGEACDSTGVAPNITPNLTVACQPNISRQKYSSLVSANSVGTKNASLLGLPAGPITVQRRVGTSGTQSSSNAFFLNAPCATGAPLGAGTVAGLNTSGSVVFPGGVTVRSNNGSGDVKTQLTAQSTAGTYGLGVLSLENVPSATEKFSFLKLNGVSPTLDSKQRATAIAGDYEFWYELVAFTAFDTTAGPSAEAGGALITSTVAALADPVITDLTGIFITAAAGVSGSNVSTGSKVGNACAVPLQ